MDPMNPVTPGARRRPTAVTASSYLLYAVAAVTVLNAVLSLSFVSRTADVYRDAYAGSTAAGTENVIIGAAAVGVAINVLFAIGLVVLALFNNRGRNASRITTWVVGGVSLCCGSLGLAGTALTGSFNMQTTGPGMPDPAEVERRINDVLPSWYTPVVTILSVATLLATLAALILLALPAANEFFRKPEQVWDPSMPGLPYPGGPTPPYPGQPYPGASGASAAGQGYPQHPYPTYPGQPGGASSPPQPPGAAASGPPPGEPHTGGVAPSDPWNAPTGDGAPDRPPTDRPPTDRPPTDPPSAV